MPRNYTPGEDEPDDTLDVINKQQPYYSGSIEMAAPVDAAGERYRNIVEFDLTDSDVYDDMLAKYPTAWVEYYDDSAPGYSAENAVKLQEAIKFHLYINEGESANVVPFLVESGEEEEIAFEVYEGIISNYEGAFKDAPRISPYMKESGGTYEHPNAFYDQTVYGNVESSGFLPLVIMDGDTAINDRVAVNANLADMYSVEQLALKEYQTSRATPKSQYDWGGSYSTGKNTY